MEITDHGKQSVGSNVPLEPSPYTRIRLMRPGDTYIVRLLNPATSKYVTVPFDGGRYHELLLCDQNEPTDSTKFTLTCISHDGSSGYEFDRHRFSFHSHVNGKYVVSDPDRLPGEGHALVASKQAVGEWEKFHLIFSELGGPNGENEIFFIQESTAIGARIVRANFQAPIFRGGLKADTFNRGDWEQFAFVII